MNTKKLFGTTRRSGASAIALAVACVAFSATSAAADPGPEAITVADGENRTTAITYDSDITVSGTDEGTQSGTITGTETQITKKGSGQLNLTGENDYGTTIVDDGALNISGATTSRFLSIRNGGSRLIVDGADASFTVTGGDITEIGGTGSVRAYLQVLNGASFSNTTGSTTIGTEIGDANLEVIGAGSSFSSLGLTIKTNSKATVALGATVNSGNLRVSGDTADSGLLVVGQGSSLTAAKARMNNTYFRVADGATFTSDSLRLRDTALGLASGSMLDTGNVLAINSLMYIGLPREEVFWFFEEIPDAPIPAVTSVTASVGNIYSFGSDIAVTGGSTLTGKDAILKNSELIVGLLRTEFSSTEGLQDFPTHGDVELENIYARESLIFVAEGSSLTAGNMKLRDSEFIIGYQPSFQEPSEDTDGDQAPYVPIAATVNVGDIYSNSNYIAVGEASSLTAGNLGMYNTNLFVGHQPGPMLAIDMPDDGNQTPYVPVAATAEFENIFAVNSGIFVTGGSTITAGDVFIGARRGTHSELYVDGASFNATSLTFSARRGSSNSLIIANGGSVSLVPPAIMPLALDDDLDPPADPVERVLNAGRNTHINIGNGGTAGTLDVDRVEFGRGSTLTFDHTDDTTFAAEIDGRVRIRAIGGGTTTFTADSGYIGRSPIYVDNGSTIQFGDGGETGWIDGNVYLGGEYEYYSDYLDKWVIEYPASQLIINRSDDVTFSRQLFGSGDLVKEGTGTLTLDRRLRHFRGDVDINEGTLALTGRASLRRSTVTIGEDGTFDISGIHRGRTTVYTIYGDGNVVLGDKSLRLDYAENSFYGTISGTGNLYVDGYRLTLHGENTFTGTTYLGYETDLRFRSNGSIVGDIDVDGGIVIFDRDNVFNYAGSIRGWGDIEHRGKGLTNLTGDNSEFGGNAEVLDGTLAINGIFGGHVDVVGGRLRGTGKINYGVDLLFGGILAPGNSIGTLTIEDHLWGEGGVIEIETKLGGNNSVSDQLIVNGEATGRAFVRVLNEGGLGEETTDGIRFLTVNGDSDIELTFENPDYLLNGKGVVTAGAYGYTLEENSLTSNDGHWYLRSNVEGPDGSRVTLYQPSVPVYEAYAASIGAISNLNTFQQRIGNRTVSSLGGAEIWGRVEGSHLRNQAVESSSFVSTATDVRKYQLGTDIVASTDADGSAFVFGFNVFSGRVNTDVSSMFGDGAIKTSGYGVGFSITRQNTNGFYADAQAQFSWTEGTLSSRTFGALANKNGGDTQAFSLEVGKRYGVGSAVALTPQVQVTYTNAKFDAFTDLRGLSVELDEGQRLRGRAGLALDRRGEDSHVYAIVDLNYDMLDGTRVNVAGTSIGSRDARAWASVGVGGSQSFGGVTYFGEVSGTSAIGGLSDSYGMKGNAGIRLRF